VKKKRAKKDEPLHKVERGADWERLNKEKIASSGGASLARLPFGDKVKASPTWKGSRDA